VFSSSIITPFVQPNPDCTVYSPPPPYFPGFSASYCEYKSDISELSRVHHIYEYAKYKGVNSLNSKKIINILQ
jgi:hypothetical protein